MWLSFPVFCLCLFTNPVDFDSFPSCSHSIIWDVGVCVSRWVESTETHCSRGLSYQRGKDEYEQYIFLRSQTSWSGSNFFLISLLWLPVIHTMHAEYNTLFPIKSSLTYHTGFWAKSVMMKKIIQFEHVFAFICIVSWPYHILGSNIIFFCTSALLLQMKAYFSRPET